MIKLLLRKTKFFRILNVDITLYYYDVFKEFSKLKLNKYKNNINWLTQLESQLSLYTSNKYVQILLNLENV